MSFRPSLRLTSLAAGLLLAVTATAQPVFDQPASATFKGTVISRGENVVPGSAAEVIGRGFVPGQQVSLVRGDSVLNAQPLVVDADGNFKTQLAIPADAVPGTHPVVVRASQPSAATVLKLRVSRSCRCRASSSSPPSPTSWYRACTSRPTAPPATRCSSPPRSAVPPSPSRSC